VAPRRFTTYAGTSPVRYLIRARVDRAHQLLTDTNMSVSYVAATLGYADVACFSRQYKRTTGRSPRAARWPAAVRLVGAGPRCQSRDMSSFGGFSDRAVHFYAELAGDSRLRPPNRALLRSPARTLGKRGSAHPLASAKPCATALTRADVAVALRMGVVQGSRPRRFGPRPCRPARSRQAQPGRLGQRAHSRDGRRPRHPRECAGTTSELPSMSP
jgi:AraC-like DNA-binding protein